MPAELSWRQMRNADGCVRSKDKRTQEHSRRTGVSTYPGGHAGRKATCKHVTEAEDGVRHKNVGAQEKGNSREQ